MILTKLGTTAGAVCTGSDRADIRSYMRPVPKGVSARINASRSAGAASSKDGNTNSGAGGTVGIDGESNDTDPEAGPASGNGKHPRPSRVSRVGPGSGTRPTGRDAEGVRRKNDGVMTINCTCLDKNFRVLEQAADEGIDIIRTEPVLPATLGGSDGHRAPGCGGHSVGVETASPPLFAPHMSVSTFPASTPTGPLVAMSTGGGPTPLPGRPACPNQERMS